MARLPYLSIPLFPQIGQPFAFAGREDQVAQLYGAMVDAGNALIQGQPVVPARVVVTGYKGVGKSSLIVKALNILRDPIGQAHPGLAGLRDPEEPQRWLVLRVSGKHVRGIEGLPDDLHRSVLGILQDAANAIESTTPGALRLNFFHRTFKTGDHALFEKVRVALTAFTLMVDFVRAWRGAKMSERIDEVSKTDRSKEIKLFLDTQIKLKGIKPDSVEGQGAVGLATSFIHKWSQALESKRSLEHEVTINADLATEALNAFFKATSAARIPTLFVLDDFDELASGAGVSQAARAKQLMEVLGVFNQLAPTCLVIAVRQEYLHEDLIRQFRSIYLAPMTRSAGGEMLDAWVGTHTMQWSDETRAALRKLGELFVGAFPADMPVVLPDRFLPLTTWSWSNGRAGESAKTMLVRYLRLTFDGETFRAVQTLANALSSDDRQLCAETVPIDPEPYAIRPSDRLALQKSGLLRPAMAWSDADTRVILDPLIAYLAVAAV
jgi:hypothetical protein